MSWLKRSASFFLGCGYALLALALFVLFVPAMTALFIGFLWLCVFNTAFFKQIAIASFTRAMAALYFLLGNAAASFRAFENPD